MGARHLVMVKGSARRSTTPFWGKTCTVRNAPDFNGTVTPERFYFGKIFIRKLSKKWYS
jgi:hypothetical protein